MRRFASKEALTLFNPIPSESDRHLPELADLGVCLFEISSSLIA